jgi:hypothetical protein
MIFLNFSQFSGKCFLSKIKGKHFPGNQAKFFFDRKVFSVDQLSYWQINTGKFGKWFPGNFLNVFFFNSNYILKSLYKYI